MREALQLTCFAVRPHRCPLSTQDNERRPAFDMCDNHIDIIAKAAIVREGNHSPWPVMHDDV
jgi:hypothetical protein